MDKVKHSHTFYAKALLIRACTPLVAGSCGLRCSKIDPVTVWGSKICDRACEKNASIVIKGHTLLVSLTYHSEILSAFSPRNSPF